MQVWPQAFQGELGKLPSEMKSPCCSTFMVARDRIMAHDISFYKHLRDWIITYVFPAMQAWHLV